MTRIAIKCLAPLLALAAPVAALAHPISAEIAARIDASSVPQPGEPSLAEVRAATERFRHVEQALAEGYIRDPANVCDDAAMMGKPANLGAMGIHYFRPDLLGITAPPNPRVDGVGTHTDFNQPAVLIYEPQADGAVELVAVENLVFIKAWEAAGNDAPPSFHGVAWDRMVDDPATALDEAHNFEPHYDRHVWLYRENPNGVFAQYNPMATCANHDAAPHMHGDDS
ncbi:MAG: hypothetical protein M9955_13700 [Rhizobiaceae bacterium]|nr:hypothetical protein [Rhizobiaceae bacterium]